MSAQSISLSLSLFLLVQKYRPCSKAVIHGGLQPFFRASVPLTEANQHLADGAGVLRAYADHVATIIETNLTRSTEELEQAITLYQILTGVLNDIKKVVSWNA